MDHKWSRDGETCLRCGDKDWRARAECEPKERYVAELEAERDRLREVGKWLAAEARENWDKGRLSVDLMTAVEAWDRAALEGE